VAASAPDLAVRRPAPTSRDRRVDLLVAIGFALAALLSSVLYRVAGIYDEPAPGWATLPYAVAIALPLVWRRRFPSIAALAIATTFAVAQAFSVPEILIGNIALFLALYSVGAWESNRTRAHVVRIVIIAGLMIWLFVALYLAAAEADPGDTRGPFSPFAAFTLIQVLTNVLYFGGAYYYGERARVSALERLALDERTAELEVERERLAEQAVALDRVRIARELHDSVAHHVSVMGVQAGAARSVLTTDPAAASDALRHVEDTARSAIDELHGLLRTLRDADSAPDAAPASTVGVAALPALVQASRDAGLPTDLEVVGDPRPLPPTLSLNLYRVAQEALTNARKHAGADATAEVRLRYLAGSVELEVANTGAARTLRVPGGLGQLGMRERVATSGGSLEVGPRSRGGYLVRARFPFAASS
jgi:signal transduction histidine kinase